MTVRWKPLIVLSGLFLAFAAAGLRPSFRARPRQRRGSCCPARAAQAAGRFDDAKIHFDQALQLDGRTPRSPGAGRCYADWTATGRAARSGTR